VRGGDLVLVAVNDPSLADDFLPADVEPVGAVRRREDERGDGIVGPSELERVCPPDGEVGTAAGLERAEVVSAENLRAAAGREPERLPRRHRLRTASRPRHEERLPGLVEQVAALVRGRSVDADPDPDPLVEELAHRCNPGSQPHVGAGAVGDTGACLAHPADVRVAQMDAMRAPHVPFKPPELLQILEWATAEDPLAVLLFLEGLRQVGVQLQAEVTG
jgi:hypothetical protein